MENKDIILYGAGKRGKYVVNKIKELGWNPVAFCDKDDNKIGTIYCGLPVLSKEDIKNKYGNQFQIWITPSYDVRKEIAQEIIELGFVSKEQICNYNNDDTDEEYVSCYHLKYTAIISHDFIYSCCILNDDLRNQSPSVRLDNMDLNKSINSFLDNRQKIIDSLKNGQKCICDGCSQLKKLTWENNDNKIQILALSPSYPCQLSCKYCSVTSNAKIACKNTDIIQQALDLDIIAIVKQLENRNMLDLQEPIQLSGGEITINPKKREILSYLSKYPLQIFSNCVIYDEQVSELIARDGSFLNVSIDAGTPETYKIVKGLDVFDKVVNNIKRYSDEGGNIEIKYILLEDNCDKNNIDGFVNICEKCNLNMVNISVDLSIDSNNIPKSIIEGAIYMANRLYQENIKYNILPYFSEDNMNYIKSKLKNQFINYE